MARGNEDSGSTATLLAFLVGFAWAFDFTVRYLAP